MSLSKLWRRAFFLILILFFTYFATRLLNLTKLPIFTDEAIYIRWSQIGSRDAAWRFISLSDGKQPLFTWLVMLTLRLFKDPLFAGRIVSVLAGAVTMIGVAAVTWELFKNKTLSVIASIFYLISPFALMYDRLALYDSLVATFYIWSFYLSILLARRLQLDTALLLGLVLGAGMLNKSSGFLSLYLLPTTIIFLKWEKRNLGLRILHWLGLSLVAAILSQILYNILRLSPLFHMVALKDAVFIYSFAQWLSHPFTFLRGNLNGLFDWLTGYLTKPIFILALIPLLSISKHIKEKAILYIWWLAPFLALASFGKVLYPRFIFFMSVPLIILASLTVYEFLLRYGKTLFGFFLLFICVFPGLYIDYFIITNPIYAQIPYADRGQLMDDWPSGWGIREVVDFLTQQTRQSMVTIYTEGTFGLLPYALEIYLGDNPNIEIKGIWPIPEKMPDEMLEKAKDHPTYILFNQTQEVISWPITPISEYQKGVNKRRKMRLFQVTMPLVKL